MQKDVLKNKRLSESEFNEQRVKLECLPHNIAIYTTDKCNLRCINCHYGIKEADEISITEEGYRNIFNAFPYLEGVGIAGAEMFFDAGNPKGYMKRVFGEGEKSGGLKYYGFTNGTLLTPERIKLIVEKFKWIGISIDSTDPEIYKTIRVGSNLDLVVRNIRKIACLKAERGLGRSDNPEIVVSSVISEKTYKDVLKMIDLADEVGAASIHFQAPWEWTYENDNVFSNRSKTMEYLSLRRKADEKAELLGIKILDRTHNTILKRLPLLKKHLMLSRDLFIGKWPQCCNAPWNELYIWRNGDVKICCTSKTVLGSVNEKSIEEIWNSPKAIEMRKRILMGDYSKDCAINCYRGYVMPRSTKDRLRSIIRMVLN